MTMFLKATLVGGSWCLALFGWVHYLQLIPKEKVPSRPLFHTTLMVLSCLLAATYIILSLRSPQPLHLGLVVASVLSFGVAAFFLYLLTQAPLPDNKIKVSVGEPMLPVTGLDSAGQTHRLDPSSGWTGQRLLFKFFRGHW